MRPRDRSPAAQQAAARIYAKACLALAAETGLHAMAHVTGGGLAGNLARVMPEELSATVDRSTWVPAPIFDVAHYGTTEDLFDVLPALTEALQGVRAAG